jgi:hypothetical protein
MLNKSLYFQGHQQALLHLGIPSLLKQAARKKDPQSEIPVGTLAGISGGSYLTNKLLGKHYMRKFKPPPRFFDSEGNILEAPVVGNPDNQKLYDSMTDADYKNNPRSKTKPRWDKYDPELHGNIGPYYDPKHSIYSHQTFDPEVLAHELGHSMQSNATFNKVRRFGMEGTIKGGLPNSIASLLAYREHDKHPGFSDAAVYGGGALGALSVGSLLGPEVGASARGYNLMRRAGMKPRISKLFGPNLTYALAGSAFQGIPITLAVKRFLDNRKNSSTSEVPESLPTP